MMLSENIDYLIRREKLNHNQFGVLFGLKGSVISTYVRGKSLPKYDVLIKISDYFNITIDDLLKVDLSKQKSEPAVIYIDDKPSGMNAEEPASDSFKMQVQESILTLLNNDVDFNKILQNYIITTMANYNKRVLHNDIEDIAELVLRKIKP